jgi:NAD-dependent deacetylase
MRLRRDVSFKRYVDNSRTVKMLGRAVELISNANHVLVLTGAGISADSGIPTFRGKEGYWTIGSKNYHPQELARLSAFRQMPDEVWSWYLYRREICNKAEPNPSHYALVELETLLTAAGRKFTLVTQNVDGLHLRAGS